MTERIRAIHAGVGGVYGSPRVTAELHAAGAIINHKRIERLMRQGEIIGCTCVAGGGPPSPIRSSAGRCCTSGHPVRAAHCPDASPPPSTHPDRSLGLRQIFYPPDVIVLAVRWYRRFNLSYRDLEELLAERGIEVDHTTVCRWVQRFTPLLADAARPCQLGRCVA